MNSVFAASDRPTVIFSNNKKLIYSNVNVQEVLHVCPFSSEAFPDALALASEEELTIGGIDDIQKCTSAPFHWVGSRDASHIRQIRRRSPLWSNTCGPRLTKARSSDSSTTPFESLNQFQLEENELASALTSCSFAGDESTYYVVGTGFALEQEDEPTRGRILVFKVIDDALSLVCEKEVRGRCTT